MVVVVVFFFFKQKTAYEIKECDWSSDVCSSDLGIRVRDDATPLQPGEFRDVDAPGGSLKEAFFPLPYKEPSQTLLQLMGIVVQAGQRFASIADMQEIGRAHV